MSLMTLLLSFWGCNAQDKGYCSLSVEDYDKAIADTSVFRLDVRTEAEYMEGHIEFAVNIDVLKEDFESKATSTLPKDRTIAVNCRSGRRSKNAAQILVKHGYKVIELDAGYNGWIAAGKPIVK